MVATTVSGPLIARSRRRRDSDHTARNRRVVSRPVEAGRSRVWNTSFRATASRTMPASVLTTVMPQP